MHALEELVKKWAGLAMPAGRLLLSLIFIMAGISKITGFSGTIGYMSAYGMPMPEVLAVIALLVELLGGLSVLLGFKGRLGAAVLFLFLIPTTFIFHAFWSVPAEQAMMQQMAFMKNLAIMGGMLAIATFGPGSLSFDNRQETA